MAFINQVGQRMPKSPSTSLKLGAVVFAVLWTLWLLSWSRSLDRGNVLMLSVGGVVVGSAWYCAMRWQFRREGLSREDDSAN